MQRVRMSLPYYRELGWEAEVVMVDERYADLPKDDLLLQSLPPGVKIHRVKALNKQWTAKIGLGSLALRSLWFYRNKVTRLLKMHQYDLIFFSTTQFPVCVLGAYWKKRFGVPYVIDMQDPWHSTYYQDKPKQQRPPKYWFSYRLNKYLEPIAMKQVSGLISVSQAYIDELKARYPETKNVPSAIITFGHFAPDMAIASANSHTFNTLLDPAYKSLVYIGRGGTDMHKAIAPLFSAIKNHPAYSGIKLYFIGTSYAPAGQGKYTILPLAEQYDITDQVIEITDRISYYHTLAILQQADALFIPGSDDPAYTASKIYPYILVNKPLLAIFNPQSTAIGILKDLGVKHVYGFDKVSENDITSFIEPLLNGGLNKEPYNQAVIDEYSAQNLTAQQTALFNQAIN